MKRFVPLTRKINLIIISSLSLLLLLFLASCRNLPPLQRDEGRSLVPAKVKSEQFLQAAERGDLDEVRELIDRDPSLLEAQDSSGWDALSYAAWGAHQQVHEYLLRQGAEGNLFTEAALGPLEGFVGRLETNPIGVDSRDAKRKATPLIWAVRTGNQVGCEVLLSQGADALVRDRDGNTVLHHAVLMDRLDLLSFLLFAGADPEAANKRGQTALHLVTAAGSYSACQLLLEHEASLDRPDGAGNTPLHIAAARGDFELCEYFLFLGAAGALKNHDGQTPLDLAQTQGHDRVIQLLSAHAR
jgi:ankyrin repeat protein